MRRSRTIQAEAHDPHGSPGRLASTSGVRLSLAQGTDPPALIPTPNDPWPT